MVGMVRLAPLPLLLLAACSDTGQPAEGSTASPAAVPVASAAPETAPTEADAGFRYTRLADCTLTRSAPEEAGFFEHECAGEGGYRLRKSEADLRDNLVVLAPGSGEHDLGLPTLARGAFSSVGDTVEWRGESEGASFTPRALIVRQIVMEDPDPAVPEVSYLVVARLQPAACVVARIPPGPGQNQKARDAADGGGKCLS